MRKIEFLEKLENSIKGELSPKEVAENISYYNQYISDAVTAGRNEEEVVEELGGPLLVAKTLLEANNFRHEEDSYRQTYGTEEEHDSNQYNQSGTTRGFHVNYTDEGWDLRFGRFKLNSWYGKLLGILIVILIIALLFTIASFLVPIVVPVLVIAIFLRLLLGGNNRRF
jgi:hypothetical protein